MSTCFPVYTSAYDKECYEFQPHIYVIVFTDTFNTITMKTVFESSIGLISLCQYSFVLYLIN